MLSRSLDDYGEKKMIAVVAINRMAEFLGKDLIKGKGITCNFIIAKYPFGTKVTDRPIPISIFRTDPSIRNRFLNKWFKG